MNKMFIISLLIMLICTFAVIPAHESAGQPDTPKVVIPVVPVANEVDKNSIKLDSMVDITVNKTAIIKKQNEEIQKLLIEKSKSSKSRTASTTVERVYVDTCIIIMPQKQEANKKKNNIFNRIFK